MKKNIYFKIKNGTNYYFREKKYFLLVNKEGPI